MPTQRDLFLRAVLGPDGAKVLGRVAKSSPAVAAVLAPRAALAWLGQRTSYEGAIPGVADSYLRLEKVEAGFTGEVTLGDGLHTFEAAPPERVAAAVVMALGDSSVPRQAGRDIDLARLGKTVDLLVRARSATRLLAKGVPAGPQKGATAAPIAPEKPEPKEDFEEDKVPNLPGVKKKPKKPTETLKLSQREAATTCAVCQAAQFRAGQFTGCYCLRDLAKSVTATPAADGVVLTLGSGWDADAVLTLLEAVGRR